MKNLTTRVDQPNYTHIYFPYSTVTSACQGSGLAWQSSNTTSPFHQSWLKGFFEFDTAFWFPSSVRNKFSKHLFPYPNCYLTRVIKHIWMLQVISEKNTQTLFAFVFCCRNGVHINFGFSWKQTAVMSVVS